MGTGQYIDVGMIAVVGIIVGFMQAVIIFILAGLKKDMANIWKRMNNHYHEVSCGNDGCKSLRTGNVIIPRESGG